MNDIPEELEVVLLYASLAPNPHNSQPWRIKLDPDKLDPEAGIEFLIQSDSTRWLPNCDPVNRDTVLTIGAFWENLEQAASALGYETHTEILAAQAVDTNMIKVKLEKTRQSSQSSTEPLQLMKQRYTNRKMYSKEAITPHHLEECCALLPGSLAYFPRESREGKWLSHNQTEAMRQQVFNDEKQGEMAKWMRFSPAEALERKDGSTAEMAGFSGLAKFLWNHFLTPQQVMSRGVRTSTVNWMKKRVNWCAGFFVVTSADDSVSSLLQTGKAIERLVLHCTRLKIQTTMVSQLIHESPWNRQLNAELGMEKPVQMLLIAGYPRKPPRPPVHLRRPVQDFCY